MFDGVICADDVFTRSPIINAIYDQGSKRSLPLINDLWSEKKLDADDDFSQRVQSVFPSLVRQIENGAVTETRINMNPLVALMTKAIAEQQEVINKQQEQLDKQQKQIDQILALIKE